jgi:hypothetical protein
MAREKDGTVFDFLPEQANPEFQAAALDLRNRLEDMMNKLYENPTIDGQTVRLWYVHLTKEWIRAHLNDV